MSIIKSILRRLRGEAFEREIEEELHFHIEMRTRDNIVAGMSPVEAERDARQRFGDFDHVSAECRETLIGGVNMKAMKGIAWVMLGCGLTLNLTSDIHTVRQMGQVLVCIAVLWWLLLYLRATQPDQRRINQRLETAEQTPLNLTMPVRSPVSKMCESGFAEPARQPSTARDDQGRTPIERLFSDGE